MNVTNESATDIPIDLSMAACQLTVNLGTEMKTTKPFTQPAGVNIFMRYSVSKDGVRFLFSDKPGAVEVSMFVEWED